MKILKIEFENINSLRGKHEIDFTKAPFTSSSLFAITGPTGSGKSSILDVISLALFNQVPRLGKISKNEILSKGAILTRNQDQASASVTYECKNGIFSSKWSIYTNRNHKLKDYEMELSEPATGKILDIRKSDVPAKNEALIGLNYNQFIKAVLLAQGEFAQFLKAKKDERGELLEKITGTGIYRQMGILAFQKHKVVNQEILLQIQERDLIKKELLKEDKRKEFSEDLTLKETACKPLEAGIELIGKSIELKGVIAGRQKEIFRLNSENIKAEAGLKTFELEYGFPLNQHEKVQPFSDDLRNWKQLKNIISELQEDLVKNELKESENGFALKAQHQKINNFIGGETSEENLEIEVRSFTGRVSKIQQERKEKLADYTSFKNQFQTQIKEIPFRLNEKNLAESIANLNLLKNSSEVNILGFQELLKDVELNNSEKEKERLKKGLENAGDAVLKADKLEQISADLFQINSEEEKITPQLKELPGEIERSELNAKILGERLEKLKLKRDNQLLLAKLEEHRSELIDGEPCPLCGAVHHPYAEDVPEKDNSIDVEIGKTGKELTEWTTKLATDLSSLKHFRERSNEVTLQKNQLEADLKFRKTEFSDKFSHLQQSQKKSDWETFCDNYRTQIANLESYEKENRRLNSILEGLPLLHKMSGIINVGLALKEKLDSLYSGTDILKDSQELHTRWTQLKQDQKAVFGQKTELISKINAKNDAFKTQELSLINPLKEQGFESIEAAEKALMPDAEYNMLRSKRENIRKEIAQFVTSIKLLKTQLEEFQKSDVERSAEELIGELNEKNEDLKKFREDCEALRRILNNDKDYHVKQQKIQAEIAKKEKHIRRWRLLNELIGDSKGKNFNDFAQDLSLSQLLLLANKRMKDLSDRYKIDKPGLDEDDGLVAIDEHMGGQRRSVKTLSGGETFILSLSMALALSDLASKNVEINSLFIDEGFGSLDSETLDQTLDSLEKLQAESSKTIGIISHVDSLKERIATQIKLQRNGQGYSSLEVC
jgi:exonuclease SbcC